MQKRGPTVRYSEGPVSNRAFSRWGRAETWNPCAIHRGVTDGLAAKPGQNARDFPLAARDQPNVGRLSQAQAPSIAPGKRPFVNTGAI